MPPVRCLFAALSDATRRGVLEQLGRGDASVGQLADRFHMTLTGMKKRISVLERAGLVAEKHGRVRTCRLGLSGLEDEAALLDAYRRMWAAWRFSDLDRIVEELKLKESENEHDSPR